MILVFIKICFSLLDHEIEQVCTGMLSKSKGYCSAARLLHAAVIKLASIIGTNAIYELSTLFSPVAHYANISYDMIDFL